MRKIAVFYHLHQVGNWENIFCEQISRLQGSGLLNTTNYFFICVNGDLPLPVTLTFNHTIIKNTDFNSEYDTLNLLYNFCKENNNYNILYLNSLGVIWSKEELNGNKVPTPFGEYSYETIGYNKSCWRKYLEYFTIDKWQECVVELNNYDCVGVEYIDGGFIGEEAHNCQHFSGNFWWANSDYIATLDPQYMIDNKYGRFSCELWIGTNKPKCKSLYNFNKNLYCFEAFETEYTQGKNMNFLRPFRPPRERLIPSKNTNTHGRICMISMFKNEAKHIRKMLDSVTPYIDFWVLQDNGSTDGTSEIVNQWHGDTKIPGFLYTVEEGWVSFGWNRDHLLQRTLKAPHCCDWIMKMDCDEFLHVDEDFDWNLLNVHDASPQALDVFAKAPNCLYFRTWLWRSDLKWAISHDPAHETVYIREDNDYKNFNYSRGQLSTKFKMVAGESFGESYENPTKYVSDALKLEEKLIREGTMLTNNYHFWYIGKSYEDGYVCPQLPLGDIHKREFARRCIFYFEEVLAHTQPGYRETKKAYHIDEMSYYAVVVIGNCYRFLGEHYKAIEYYMRAEEFNPHKNDHLVRLAEIYWELLDFKKMLQITTRLVDPERKNPFPALNFTINPDWYVDTGNHPQFLHQVALERSQFQNVGTIFALNKNPRKKIFVVDNFYEDPNMVRQYALQQEFNGDLRFYKGKRTIGRHSTPQIKQKFEEIMGEPITRWDTPSEEFGGSMNGVFQFCTPEDALVYHHDEQKWAAMIFLTPDAPLQTGTSFYRHKETGIKVAEDTDSFRAFSGGYYDATKFELIDTVGNIYNRCVIFDARQIHAATEYFGQTKEDSRLFHIFFFN